MLPCGNISHFSRLMVCIKSNTARERAKTETRLTDVCVFACMHEYIMYLVLSLYTIFLITLIGSPAPLPGNKRFCSGAAPPWRSQTFLCTNCIFHCTPSGRVPEPLLQWSINILFSVSSCIINHSFTWWTIYMLVCTAKILTSFLKSHVHHFIFITAQFER